MSPLSILMQKYLMLLKKRKESERLRLHLSKQSESKTTQCLDNLEIGRLETGNKHIRLPNQFLNNTKKVTSLREKYSNTLLTTIDIESQVRNSEQTKDSLNKTTMI